MKKSKIRWWVWLVLGLVLLQMGNTISHDSTIGNLSTIFGACFTIAAIVEGVRGRKKKDVSQPTTTGKRKILWSEIFILSISVLIFILIIALAALKSAREKGNIALCPGQMSDAQYDIKWPVYYSETPHFCARFPSYPVHDTKYQDNSNGKIKVDTYKSVDVTGSIAYAINVTEFPSNSDFSDTSKILLKSIDYAASGLSEKVLSSNLTTFDGYPAIEYLVQGSGASKVKGENFLVGQQLYQLITAYDDPEEPNVELDRFLENFVIQK
jgi:hypothetical protein